MAERLALKWGTLKGCDADSDRAKELLGQYCEIGASMSAAMQQDTPEQKQIICALIDVIDGEIYNDWSGETMSKEEAKKYVLEYGKGLQ